MVNKTRRPGCFMCLGQDLQRVSDSPQISLCHNGKEMALGVARCIPAVWASAEEIGVGIKLGQGGRGRKTHR